MSLGRKQLPILALLHGLIWLFTGCGGNKTVPVVACASRPVTHLTAYDQVIRQFLDEETKHPVKNLGGQVVWNTRYYLESLILAYEATGNVKYLRDFEDTGKSVVDLLETVTFLDVNDPSAPGQTAQGPFVTMTGWPTYMGTFGEAVPIPNANGAVAIYAQSLYPRSATGPSYLDISQSDDGSLQLAWSRAGNVLKSYTAHTVQDLQTIASEKLVFRQSIGRIAVTGDGMPAVGHYAVNSPIHTIWHAEQTGGILLSFVAYLLVARDYPGDVNSSLAASWRATVPELASEYVDEFLPDGEQGSTLHNPRWMAHESTDTDVPSDYIYAEVSLRLLLHELTQDPEDLSLARGLMQHQLSHNLPMNASGWIVLRGWPDIRSWSNKSDAPAGSIWDSLAFDSAVSESVTEGQFFAQAIHLAAKRDLLTELGITPIHGAAHRRAIDEYLRIGNADSRGYSGAMRSAYPQLSSKNSDMIIPTRDPFVGSGFLYPETAGSEDVDAHWQWMQKHATAPQGWPIGYFLRAWAFSEAAKAGACGDYL